MSVPAKEFAMRLVDDTGEPGADGRYYNGNPPGLLDAITTFPFDRGHGHAAPRRP